MTTSERELPFYELYAIRYASSARTRKENLVGSDPDPDAPMPIDYFVWAVKGPEGIWVVDTGFMQPAAARRQRPMERTPAEGLALIGIDAASVRDVVLTHVHWDHAGGQDQFPNARFHIQDRELSYAAGPCMCDTRLNGGFEPGDIMKLIENLFARRLVFHDGDATLAPGLTLHRIGGHTAGMMVVRAHTRRGWMVLASDATHFYENLATDRPFPFFCDLRGVHAGFRRLRQLADGEALIIPGHDPLVLQRHPAPEKRLEGIVARLD
jgi:glyoxylase-like metal-dependent hydrolase (beta-lactamase superfamily II)